jgi:hypothetical protein
VEPVRLPARCPNLNAYAERFVRTINSECLNRIVPLSEWHLRRVSSDFALHYHLERNHQRLGNVLFEPSAQPSNENSPRARSRALSTSQELRRGPGIDQHARSREPATGRSPCPGLKSCRSSYGTTPGWSPPRSIWAAAHRSRRSSTPPYGCHAQLQFSIGSLSSSNENSSRMLSVVHRLWHLPIMPRDGRACEDG